MNSSTINRALSDWRIVAVLGVMICFAIPACEWAGVFESRYAVIATPLAALSPVTAVIAFVVARTLRRRQREQGKALDRPTE